MEDLEKVCEGRKEGGPVAKAIIIGGSVIGGIILGGLGGYYAAREFGADDNTAVTACVIGVMAGIYGGFHGGAETWKDYNL